MKIKKMIAGLCVGLMLIVSFPKPIKAEPITILGILKIIGLITTVGGFWVAVQQATLAEHNTATNSLLKHLEGNAEFPVNGYCVSPDIKNGTIKKGWFVSIDDKKYLYPLVKSEFCKVGGISPTKNGKYIIGIFTSEYHAKNFAKVVRYRTENEINVYVSNKAIEF
ncbi:MAG: hypothetical protein RMY62_000105 [Nostoc sp. ZfuVER08]|jgi:hypothetical protein|uniref:Uncharacterized protein n=1 Tax=Nostoc punctiforme FACHB-252 TaxID=1357509 RepID=A0ABR8H1W2_NOSPU|nr:hypothetical protein [Nostoc punctiforme]MBD2609810.1 hypothetical protein [Nostoc punctiforme FACHB-252]MBL1202674.1 hypothetical protein [Nostoc sp. GBBB01]MDZ8010607.1 hypothetical protein [Nostoc sp. ZfuVER08]